MATVTAIKNKTQSGIAMRRVLDYVIQEKKTAYLNPETEEKYHLVSGQNCMPETAYREFMNTKDHYRKAKGVFFRQYVQSFKPDCGATPDQIHQMGVELAKEFDGHEVVIATHIDTDHWHNHLVVNSVNCETGLKIQINEKGLERLRQQSDAICQQFGLEILPPYQKPKQRAMNQREYRVALKGKSWKMKLLSAIDKAAQTRASKTDFIRNMKALDYGVSWIDQHKYITYTTPDGKKCRDNRLFDEKYLKSNMEAYFDGLEKAYGNQRGNQRDIDRTVPTNLGWSKTKAVECAGQTHDYGGDRINQEYGAHRTASYKRGHRPADRAGSPAASFCDRGRYEFSDEAFDRYPYQQADGSRVGYPTGDIETEHRHYGTFADAGLVPSEAQDQVGVDWGGTSSSIAALGDSIASMVDNAGAGKKKQQPLSQDVVSKEHQQQKKKKHERGMEMER